MRAISVTMEWGGFCIGDHLFAQNSANNPIWREHIYGSAGIQLVAVVEGVGERIANKIYSNCMDNYKILLFISFERKKHTKKHLGKQ